MHENKQIKILKSKNLTWINITKPAKKEIGYLQKYFDFHPLDLEDCLPPLQRPKLLEHHNYLFMILQFPVYNRKTKTLKSTEVDFFITPKHLITVHNNELKPLKDFFELCDKDISAQEKYINGDASSLLYEILDRLLNYCFPMLNHISQDIDNIEKEIFTGYEKKMVHKILNTKRNIVNFRKAMQAHKNVIKRLAARIPKFLERPKQKVYFNNLIEYTKDIWDLLQNHKETIDALHDTNESLISFRLNDIMKLLTIISVTLLPINMIASVFGMNTEYLPLIKLSWGFWSILVIMLVVIAIMLVIFKKKKWL